MPGTDGAASVRPRPLLLALLAVVLAVAVIYAVWPAASAPPAPSNSTRAPQSTAGQAAAPGSLDVRLEALDQPPPAPGAGGRNPFRFYVPPPPPPPPPVSRPSNPSGGLPPVSGAPSIPPIPLKFIGTLERGTMKVAIFSDGRGVPLYGTEGELILGQYRIVHIGVESVVMEYADGRGRQTIPMRGA